MTPLRKLAAIGRDQKRKMREMGRLEAGGAKDQDVLEGVRQMVLPANDVADAEIDIVGAGSEMVRRRAAASEKGEVFDIVRHLRLLAVDEVVKGDGFTGTARDTKAENEFFAEGGAMVALFAEKFRVGPD